MPYTNYLCSINGKVNKKDYVIYTGEKKTLSDKPIFQSQIEVTHPDHNSLEIKCDKREPKIIWNGGKGTFKAEITYSGETITKTSHTCLFTFLELYYLTTYDVKITAMNTEGYSDVIKREATTKYNDKAVIGCLIGFLIIVTSAVLLKIYYVKRKRDGEDEDCVNQDIFTNCEYVNVSMHGMETKQQTIW
ncbi:receptor-type tyrosine-protein phosphatase C-like [Labeo rohita]|uniref:receptor-type tyrosine-protein phosphatase C-like n=1 Tax=Labeo rohita TaxID=84645 RepID=UPI0021E2A384|nr:receptor-type tyrosine-protein phosphatase C-like [Labeo rohita]